MFCESLYRCLIASSCRFAHMNLPIAPSPISSFVLERREKVPPLNLMNEVSRSKAYYGFPLCETIDAVAGSSNPIASARGLPNHRGRN